MLGGTALLCHSCAPLPVAPACSSLPTTSAGCTAAGASKGTAATPACSTALPTSPPALALAALACSCKFAHPFDKAPRVEFNSLGLPLRPGEPECSFYLKHYRQGRGMQGVSARPCSSSSQQGASFKRTWPPAWPPSCHSPFPPCPGSLPAAELPACHAH